MIGGDVEPRGICGSGLIDVVAQLRLAGLLERQRHAALARRGGRAEHPLAGRLRVDDEGVRGFALTDDVVITQRDIRELQQAKGAIATGIEAAMRERGLAAADLDEVLLAGSFGTYIDPLGARVLGLVPPVAVDRIRAVGNTASEGAKMALLSFREREVAFELPGVRRVPGAVGRGGLQRTVHRERGVPSARRRESRAPSREPRADDVHRREGGVHRVRRRRDRHEDARRSSTAGDADVHGISSDLHMTPLEIAPAVEEKLKALLPKYDRVIVVYGDCGTGGRLDEVLARYPAARPAGVHCFQWYAGELYRRFETDIGIYFLTDWLVTNWDRAVIKGLGLDRFPLPKDTYFGNITRILFVRQHPDPGPRGEGARDRGVDGQAARDPRPRHRTPGGPARPPDGRPD